MRLQIELTKSAQNSFEVVDETDEVSSKYCFEVVDELTKSAQNMVLRL
ncbi:hypothetical protein [Streptococcus pneumoniae]|nr:hypothetical protein [Streptococcus pneumoniae]